MTPSILQRYKRGRPKPPSQRVTCEDCLFLNPFGKFCELHKEKTSFRDPCREFEDRRKELLKKIKMLGELPKAHASTP